MFLEMTTGYIPRAVISQQPAHHQAPFERAHNQGRQFPGIDVPAGFPASITTTSYSASHVESLKFNVGSVADSANQGREVQTNEVGHPDRLRFPLEEV